MPEPTPEKAITHMDQKVEEDLPYNGGWRKIYASAAEELGYKAEWFGSGSLRISKEGVSLAYVDIKGKTFKMSDIIKNAEKQFEASKAKEKLHSGNTSTPGRTRTGVRTNALLSVALMAGMAHTYYPTHHEMPPMRTIRPKYPKN